MGTINKKKVFTFDANWDRKGTIEFTKVTCHICKKVDVPGISIDSSDGEYGPGNCCLQCIESINYNN